jgi:hypothetical protein
MTDATRNELLMVLLDAIESYYANLMSESARTRRELAQAEQWFANHDASDPSSFESICADLAIDPERIRQALARRRAELRGSR